jgi:UDP-glucose:glycoprotein glucosyltransferase
MPLTLILSPATLIDGDSDVPITSYYRFVADSNAMPDSATPSAHFSHLPANHLLTLRMDVPEPWDVQQSLAVQDTDNLRCDLKAGCGDDAYLHNSELDTPESQHLTRAEYGLKGLLFFGQCYERGKSQTNGLQLTLSKSTDFGVEKSAERDMEVGSDGSTSESNAEDIDVPSVYSDTLVMKTAGYWQLRANPGVWTLKLAERSKGVEIFEIVEGSVKGGRVIIDKDSIGNNSTRKTMVMKDFVSRSQILLVNRRPGHEETSIFFDKDNSRMTQGQEEEDDVVHVFSLATGHLYERFLKIMMLSVTKRTSVKVKFWFLENYLSPTFKASARAMAESIGCDVEFVTYKWPSWLRAQSEKQRIIWGYKILFLDVLFPLNVKKIIYVDADQVVRGDLKELWDMDLEGAPYGYTPMCTSREATLGYQFWNEGFWKRHLRGKPYHISALYVVDLETFRRDLVGDKLRSTYQQLSADPNSLSNLDQDLPNYAQHDVPIFSLPQEWLWCESWCSDETKATAKTIDLCNNPMHKEPKVSMAKRVISGGLFNESWVELDAEVESYDQEYFQSIDTKM